MLNSNEKAEMLKSTIYQLYTNEGRSRSYISKLLKINRKTLSDKIKKWQFPDPEPMHHMTPSNKKFLNKNKNLIKSRLDNDIPMTKIAEELKISRHVLYKTFILNDAVLTKAHSDYIQRIKDGHSSRISKAIDEPSREYVVDLEGEMWKPILGYPDYDVSNKGRIRRLAKRYNQYYIVQQYSNIHNGRSYVTLYTETGKKNLIVARLVAHAFVEGHSDKKNTVNHKDGDVTNNKSDNLEWVSQSENNEHAYEVLNRKKVNSRTYHFDKILYKNKYEFKTVRAFAKFIGKSETQTRRYLDEPDKHDIKFIKNCND